MKLIGVLLVMSSFFLLSSIASKKGVGEIKSKKGLILGILIIVGAILFSLGSSSNGTFVDYEKLVSPKNANWETTFSKEQVKNTIDSDKSMIESFSDDDRLNKKEKKELTKQISYFYAISHLDSEILNIYSYMRDNDYSLSKSEAKMINQYLKDISKEMEKYSKYLADNYKHQPVELHVVNSFNSAKSLTEASKMSYQKKPIEDIDEVISTDFLPVFAPAIEYFYDVRSVADIVNNFYE